MKTYAAKFVLLRIMQLLDVIGTAGDFYTRTNLLMA
jgi:hypothetical protein